MKRFKRLLALLLSLCMMSAFIVPASGAETSDSIKLYSAEINGETVNYWLYTPANAVENMPLITFLHGGTGARNDVSKLTDASYPNLPYYLASDQVNVNAYVLMPHTGGDKGFDADTVIALTKQIMSEKKISANKVSLTGHSMGGKSTWDIALQDKGDVFSRYAPLSGSPKTTDANVSTWKDLSIRAVYGDQETAKTIQANKDAYSAIKSANAAADITCTALPGYNHPMVVQAYLDNIDVSGGSAATYAGRAAGTAERLMDWLSFADISGGKGEPVDPGDNSGSDDSGGSTAADGKLITDKTALLEDDGTYTITLEAYATGEVVTSAEPVDICLILDISGSMNQGFALKYKTLNGKAAQLGRMYDMATTQDAMYYHRHTDDADISSFGEYKKVSWAASADNAIYTWTCACDVTCSGGAEEKSDPPLWIVDNQADYGDDTKLAALKDAVGKFVRALGVKNDSVADDLQSGLSVVTYGGRKIVKTLDLTTITSGNAEEIIRERIDTLAANGNTPTAAAFDTAVDTLNGSDRQKVYILFTDGLPTGETGSGFNAGTANTAIAAAKAQKAAGAVIYTIAVADDADPNDTTAEINGFLNGMSSNYPNATGYTVLGDGGNNGYYKVAASAEELNEIFDAIGSSYTATSVTLNDKAVLKDFLAEGFTLTEDSIVTAKSVAYAGVGQWGQDEEYSYTVKSDSEAGTISVTGFDYAERCVTEAHDEMPASGAKLVVTITGVEASDAAIGTGVDTNKPESAVYDEHGTLVEKFPQPKTTIGQAMYVLDYAKTAQLALDAFLQKEVVHLDSDGMHRFDSNTPTTTLKEQYGTVNYEETLTYTPQTMEWDGYDSFYAFGHSEIEDVTTQEANKNGNVWSKVSVLPANNVYYEDTFVTEENGDRVGIEYTGNFKQDGHDATTTVPETGINGDNHGWIEALSEQSTDTDGTATGVSLADKAERATATFTFTGSGVDIYSHTNRQTGTILVTLRGETAAGDPVAKAKIIDTVSYSGNFYQVPTCSFHAVDGLEYGTYTVTINVTTAAEGRYTYYLDGIRVYNPLSRDTEDEDRTVQEAYGDEIHACFTEIRDMLIDKNTDTLSGGAVFIDKDKSENLGAESAELGIYKDYGPKNEVYLKKDQAVVLNVNYVEGCRYYVGLKLLNGKASDSVTAGITTGNSTKEIAIKHSADMYYEITPAPDDSGNYTVTIQNMSSDNAILSITKLKVTNVPDEMTSQAFLTEISVGDALAAADAAYTAPVADAEVFAEMEKSGTAPSDPEESAAETETPDVKIENPTETAAANESGTTDMSSFVKKLFGIFAKWFA